MSASPNSSLTTSHKIKEGGGDFYYFCPHKRMKLFTSLLLVIMLQFVVGETDDESPSTVTDYTALHFAAIHGHLEVTRILLNSGANVNAVTDTGDTALIHACARNFVEVARLLLQHHADPNICDIYDISSLHMAANNGNMELAELLLDNGADPNVHAPDSHSPLHMAVTKRNYNIAELLLSYGADPNFVDKKHHNVNALDLAVLEDECDLMSLLKQYGATPTRILGMHCGTLWVPPQFNKTDETEISFQF
jgi:ankyrin repeat protein